VDSARDESLAHFVLLANVDEHVGLALFDPPLHLLERDGADLRFHLREEVGIRLRHGSWSMGTEVPYVKGSKGLREIHD
jgi:hypothetical protein